MFLITEHDVYTPDYAIVSSFYITFYNAKIAFLSLQDLLNYKSRLRSQDIYLFSDLSTLIKNDVSKQMLANVKVLPL